MCADAQVLDDVGVTGDHTSGSANARCQRLAIYFSGIAGMDAEAVGHTEVESDIRRDLGRRVGEVGMDASDGASLQPPSHHRRLLVGSSGSQDFQSMQQALASRLWAQTIARFRREDSREQAGGFQSEQLIQGERFRASWKTARDHNDSFRAHSIWASSSERTRSRILGSPSMSMGNAGGGGAASAVRTRDRRTSGPSSWGSTRPKYPRSARRRARMSCSRTGSARGTSTARRPNEKSSHTVLYPAIDTTTSASA